MDEVIFQEEVVAVLRKSLEGNDLPHLLFYGPPGTGKTSTILAIARELYGPQLMKDRVLELNASDERGIDVIRTKVKTFAQVSVGNIKAKGYPSPPFKIIILDEADSMTADAQAALRRTMEVHSKITRFCLICNYVSRIIEPLASRCAKFRFKPLSVGTLDLHLKNICAQENVKYDSGVIPAVIATSGGDMRRAITLLQSCHRWKGDLGVTTQDVTDIAGVVPEDIVHKILTACRSGSYERVQGVVQDIMADGFAAASLVDQIFDVLSQDKGSGQNLTDDQRADITLQLAQVDKSLVDGADEELQLLDLFAAIMRIMQRR
eukprot:comp11724_c0_seq2/m.6311 comp11724_c0_seq2/g.6311  ORF comp11724_c0_seq2/g.6311 comp11724_c0_seq2/m.6311 type:complete len:320 (-) comp11724_c0_seq2:303-1262(-)